MKTMKPAKPAKPLTCHLGLTDEPPAVELRNLILTAGRALMIQIKADEERGIKRKKHPLYKRARKLAALKGRMDARIERQHPFSPALWWPLMLDQNRKRYGRFPEINAVKGLKALKEFQRKNLAEIRRDGAVTKDGQVNLAIQSFYRCALLELSLRKRLGLTPESCELLEKWARQADLIAPMKMTT